MSDTPETNPTEPQTEIIDNDDEEGPTRKRIRRSNGGENFEDVEEEDDEVRMCGLEKWIEHVATENNKNEETVKNLDTVKVINYFINSRKKEKANIEHLQDQISKMGIQMNSAEQIIQKLIEKSQYDRDQNQKSRIESKKSIDQLEKENREFREIFSKIEDEISRVDTESEGSIHKVRQKVDRLELENEKHMCSTESAIEHFVESFLEINTKLEKQADESQKIRKYAKEKIGKMWTELTRKMELAGNEKLENKEEIRELAEIIRESISNFDEKKELLEEKMKKNQEKHLESVVQLVNSSISEFRDFSTKIEVGQKNQQDQIDRIEMGMDLFEETINGMKSEQKDLFSKSTQKLSENVYELTETIKWTQNLVDQNSKYAQNAIPNLSNEVNKFQAKIEEFKKKIEKMGRENGKKIGMINSRLSKNDVEFQSIKILIDKFENQKIDTKKCACCGPPVFSLCKKMDIPLTASEIEFESKCIFCESTEHKSIDCRKYSDYTERRNKLIDLNRCEKCLEPNNSIDKKKHIPCSRAMIACVYCVHDITEYVYEWNFHHSIVCKFNDKSPFRETRREKDNLFRVSINLPPLFTTSSQLHVA